MTDGQTAVLWRRNENQYETADGRVTYGKDIDWKTKFKTVACLSFSACYIPRNHTKLSRPEYSVLTELFSLRDYTTV